MATGTRERIASGVQGRPIVVGLFIVLIVIAAVSVLAVLANTPGRSIERPAASQTDVRGDVQFAHPALTVDSLAVLVKEVAHQIATTIPTRVAGPTLARNRGHEDRK